MIPAAAVISIIKVVTTVIALLMLVMVNKYVDVMDACNRRIDWSVGGPK